MSTGFDEREKAFEAKWARDEELQFKVAARRNKLLGLWAAGAMGFGRAEAEAYAKELIAADLAQPGSEDLVAKLRKDFAARKLPISDSVIRQQIERLLETAQIEIEQEAR